MEEANRAGIEGGASPRRRGGIRAWSTGLGVLLLGLFLGVRDLRAQSPQDYEGKTVVAIEFVGAVSANSDSIRSKIRTKIGQPLKLEDLNKDVKTMVEELKLFSSIEQRIVSQDSGVKIQFFVNENPIIDTIIFLGIIEIDRKELVEVIESHEGGLANDITLAVDVQRIKEKYLSKGFHFVSVEYQKQFGERTTVVFSVTEGPQVGTEEVNFVGNASFEKDDLLDAMPTTEENGFLSDHDFVETELTADLVNLEQFYRGKGFLDAEVAIEDVHFSVDKEQAFVSIRVHEGPAYMVRSVTIKGMDRYPPEEVIAEMKTKVGSRYEPAFTLALDRRMIERRYHDEAFINVLIQEPSVVDHEENLVDVVISINEGHRVAIGEVNIHNNIETKDKVIRRLLDDLTPGAPLNLNTLRRAENRIINLRYFEPNGVTVLKPDIPLPTFEAYREVFVNVKETEQEDVKNIDIEVNEADTGSIRFAVGINSNAGLVGAIVYHKDNFDPFDFPEDFGDVFDAFTGGGQTLELAFYPGIQLTQFQLSYTHPFIFDTDNEFSFDAYKRIRIRENHDEDRTGFNIGLGRRFGFNIAASARYRFEFVDITDIDRDAGQIVFDFEGENLVSSMIFGVRIADLDDFSSPGEGYRINLTYEYAGVGGDIFHNKVLLDGEYYWTLHQDAQDRKHVLFFIGHFGYVKEHSDSRDVPIYERLFAGGQNSVRGFDFRGIGPHTNGSPDGGKALITGSLNYSFPLYETILGGVVFIDTGTLAPEIDSDQLYDFRVAAGFGIRLKIAFLGEVPFAIDFGFPLVAKDEDETQIISFSLDRRF